MSITCRALHWKLRLKRNDYYGNIHTYIAYSVQFHNNNELVLIRIYVDIYKYIKCDELLLVAVQAHHS